MAETHDLLKHVHVQKQPVSQYELIPPHDPRENTKAYAEAHHHLIYELDSPCAQCGVRRSTLNDPACNPLGATQMETHHRHIMRSLANACDPAKVAHAFPNADPPIVDQASLLVWIDSAQNLIVLCDQHHRSPIYGIHHVPQEVWRAQPYFYDGYIAVAQDEGEAERAAQADEQIAAIKEQE